MPFTPAHPAAILPVLRPFLRVGAGSALVIGSMTPDFAYFVPWPDTRHQSHALPGLWSFCLPIGVLATLVYEGILRRPLAFLLPGFLRERLPPTPAFRSTLAPPVLASVVVAVAVGAFTHQVWDSFTHANGVVVDWFPITKAAVVTTGGYTVRVYKVFQHASTLLGIGLLAGALRTWCRQQPRRPDGAASAEARLRAACLAVLVLLPVAVGIGVGFVAPRPQAWLVDLREFASRAVVPTGQAAIAGLLVYSAAWWLREARQPRERNDSGGLRLRSR